MVFVAECQWGQHWLDADRVGDSAGTNLSIDVLSRIGAWSLSADIDVDGYMQKLVQQMRDGDTGSVIGSPAELNGSAQDLLAAALSAAQGFYGIGDTYSGFGVLEAEEMAPALAWAAPDFVPAAGPGQPNIAVSDGQRLVLTGESESGVIFCIEDRSGVTTYGRVAASTGIDAGVVCEAGGW